MLFFCFENYCTNPDKVLSNLFATVDLDVEIELIDSFHPKVLTAKDTNQDILSECTTIYQQLIDQSPF